MQCVVGTETQKLSARQTENIYKPEKLCQKYKKNLFPLDIL